MGAGEREKCKKNSKMQIPESNKNGKRPCPRKSAASAERNSEFLLLSFQESPGIPIKSTA
jgi:hypothetical protein